MTLLYELVLLAYPRRVREAYGAEMRLVFRDLLRDPGVGRIQLAGMMLRDLAHGVMQPEHLPSRRLVAESAMFGLIVVAFAIAARALHPGVYLGFSIAPIPFIAYLPAAFWGARRSGTFSGGVWVCLIMGLVSSTTVLWDRLLFGTFPFYDAWSFALGMLMAAGLCILPALVGSAAGAVSSPGRAPRA